VKRRLLEILACPIDKHYPLDLLVFEEKDEITEGLITCSECGRWYPIMDEIPQMLPDDLREAREDLEWLKRWKERVPEKVLVSGVPFNLSSPQPVTIKR
jgi:uncharacterized protein YbaR (Trm112 family)